MFTAKVFWRRDSVLKSGTVQFRPTSRSRLSTNPPRHGHSDQWRFHGSICRSAMPNSFHREARLDSGIAVGLLAATPACRRGIPAHLGVKPDRQRAPALECFIVGWPVPGLVGRGYGSAHASQLPPWIREMNPSRDLCNRAITKGQLCPELPFDVIATKVHLKPITDTHVGGSKAGLSLVQQKPRPYCCRSPKRQYTETRLDSVRLFHQQIAEELTTR